MKDDLLAMWSRGKADMRDVMEILRLSRAQIVAAALEAGYSLHLEDDENAEEKGAELARMIAAAQYDGTRH